MQVDPKNVGCLCNIVGLPIVECSANFVMNDFKPRAFMIVHTLPLKNKYLITNRLWGREQVAE